VAGGGIGGQLAFFHHPVPLGRDGGTRLLDGGGLGVEQQHGAAGLRGDLGDAPAHGARAHDADGLVFRCLHAGIIVQAREAKGRCTLHGVRCAGGFCRAACPVRTPWCGCS